MNYNNLQKSLDEVKEYLKAEFKSISAGVATPTVLDSVKVESYGSYMQISHLAAVNIEDAKTLKIVAWDKSQNKAIEQAIRDADLGLSLVVDSECIRVIFPQLTTETRAKYVKIAKEKLEEARIKVRQIRQDCNSEIENDKKEGNIGEDEANRKKEETQKKVDLTNGDLESQFKQKEEAIMKV